MSQMAGMAFHRPDSFMVNCKSELSFETDCPQNSEGVLIKALIREADCCYRSVFSRLKTPVRVYQFEFTVHGHCIHGEITAFKIPGQFFCKSDRVRPPVVCIFRFDAESSNFTRYTGDDHDHSTMLNAHINRVFK